MPRPTRPRNSLSGIRSMHGHRYQDAGLDLMAHYDDLSPCRYFPAPEGVTVLAVGWLEGSYEYPKGEVQPKVLERLKQFLANPWEPWSTAGDHNCSLCWRVRGYHNLWIPGRRRVYLAPELIVHYIEIHGYRPPGEFCRAVRRCPDMTSAKYLRALESAGWRVASPADSKPPARGNTAVRWVAEARLPRCVIDVDVPPLENQTSDGDDSSRPDVDVPPLER